MKQYCTIVMLCFLSLISQGREPVYAQNSPSDAGYEGETESVSDKFGDTVKEATVLNRSRPTYDPDGKRHGAFIYYPYANASVLYDDNIFAAGIGQDDVILKTGAGLKMESDWGRHYLKLQFDAENYQYKQFQSEEHTNLSGEIEGRLDVYHNTTLNALVSVKREHENRGSASAPASTTAAERTPYTAIKVAAFGDRNFGRGKLQINGSLEHFDYEDVAAVGGGTVDQDFRDGYVYKAGSRQAYTFSPGYSVFGMLELNQRDFALGPGTANRDSKGLEARAGVEFEITRLIAGEVSAGYLYQKYDDATLSDIEDLAFKVALVWNPTRLMTVNLDATRTVSETTVVNASGRIDSLVSAGLDYEIQRNLIGTAKIEFLLEDYEGVGRDDKTVTAGINFEYLINRHMRFNTYYTHQNRDSSNSTFDYEKNTVGGAVKLQF